MIVAERKKIPELVEILQRHKKILVLGCGTCVTVCLAGGEREVSIISSALRIASRNSGNDFEIDDRHLSATVGSGVIYSQLQEEAMKRGCYIIVGGGGSQCSAIANMLGDGWSPLSYRIGLPHRRILGTELVLPDGELVKMGSLATEEDPFWGEGPGPDLRGLLRGFTGLRGCLGIVTKKIRLDS